jgi:uncharacterized protein
VRLNRRFSRDVYLGIVEVTEDRGRFRVGGANRSGEPAVWMRRLPEAGTLPEPLSRAHVDTGLARRIGTHAGSLPRGGGDRPRRR